MAVNRYFRVMTQNGNPKRKLKKKRQFGIGRLWRDERGSGAAEYALILGSLGLAVVLGSTAVRHGVKTQMDSEAASISVSADAGADNGGGGSNGNGNGNGTPTPSPTPTATPTPTPTPTSTGNPGNGGGPKNCKATKTC